MGPFAFVIPDGLPRAVGGGPPADTLVQWSEIRHPGLGKESRRLRPDQLWPHPLSPSVGRVHTHIIHTQICPYKDP